MQKLRILAALIGLVLSILVAVVVFERYRAAPEDAAPPPESVGVTAAPEGARPQDAPSPTMEGRIVAVLQDGSVKVSLGREAGLKLGDRLHLRRPNPGGSSQSLAVIEVKAIEPAAATCAVVHNLADPPIPAREGDIAARWVPAGKVLGVQGDHVQISLGTSARLTRGERICIWRRAAPGELAYVTEVTVQTIGDNSTACTLRRGRENPERMPVRIGDEAVPVRTDFLNVDYSGGVETRQAG